MLRIIALTLISVAMLTAADAPIPVDVSQSVDVPDPIGLGERLALIDWLQERKIAVTNRDDVPAMRLAYLKVMKPTLFTDPEAGQKETVALDLWQRHGVNADRKDSLVNLQAMLADLDQRKGSTDAAERQRQLALSGTGPRSVAPRPAIPTAPATRAPDAAPGPAPAVGTKPAAPAAAPQAAVGAIEEAPAIEFRDLYWQVQGPTYLYWKRADGSDLYPSGIGRIDQKPLSGPQTMIWQNNTYEITSCTKSGADSWQIGFSRGSISMTKHGERRWLCMFSATGSNLPRHFRTGGEW